MVIRWEERSPWPPDFGHGVQFHSSPHYGNDNVIAFLDGFEWLHGHAESVEVLVPSPAERDTTWSIDTIRNAVEIVLREKHIEPGLLVHGIWIICNG